MTGAQRHLIQKQILEVHVPREEDAWPLQEQLGRIGRNLATAIGHCCDAASPSGRLHRIARLEVDLGRFRSAELAGQFSQRMSQALTTALKQACAEVETEPARREAALELAVRFLQHGSLPWWADPADARVLEDHLEFLLREWADAVAEVLRPLLRKPEARARAIRHFPPAHLSALVSQLAELRIEPRRLVDSLARHSLQAQSGIVAPDPPARTLWDSLLQTAADSRAATAEEFLDRVLRRWAARLHLDPAGLGDLRRTAHAATGIRTETLRSGEMQTPRQSQQQREGPSFASSSRAPLPETEEGATVALQSASADLRSPPESEPAEQEFPDPSQGGAPEPSARQRLTPDPFSENEDSPADEPNPLTPFQDPDSEFYVSNAGLALLWPFLPAFFQDLGLTESDRFTDVGAALQGTVLLQYLATGHPGAPAEYLLPLNKILCGLEPEQLHDADTGLGKRRCQAGDDFLREMIEQAPILNQMSTPGFRSTFLLRQGVLDWSDGGWRLRVDRATYDVVLDRFPWPLAWIRLPWMSAPLRLEW